MLTVAQFYLQQARLQQAADVAAASLSVAMGDAPIERARSLALANGARSVSVDVLAGGERVVRVSSRMRTTLAPVRTLHAEAVVAEPAGDALHPVDAGLAAAGSAPGTGGEYRGPLVAVDAVVVCPRVGSAYAAMQRSAAAAGVRLYAISGYRSYAEQAVLYARLGPAIAAPPGRSLHHQATELDIAVGPAGSPVHRWLSLHALAFGFVQRYSWEPWHWGNVRGC